MMQCCKVSDVALARDAARDVRTVIWDAIDRDKVAIPSHISVNRLQETVYALPGT